MCINRFNELRRQGCAPHILHWASCPQDFGKSDPPPAPDYTGAAVAQGEANKESAIASSRLNNPNVVNPYGTQTWTEGATADARPTMTQVLSPSEQAIFNKSQQAKGLLGDLSVTGAGALNQVIGKNLDLSGAPAVGGYEDTRQRTIDAMMGRINEDYGNTTDSTNSSLIAAGIRPGTKAYDDRMNLLQRGRNDAYQQAEVAGGNAASQAFNMDTQRRKDTIAEILAQRQTPLNEINALMSGSQVSNPFAVPGAAQGTNISPAPLFGATQATNAANMNAYNANQAQSANTMNGLFSLGSAALMASDISTKQNIRKIGNHPLGIGIYAYEYKPAYHSWGDGEQVGVMAQEVLDVMPEAVITHPDGYLMVNYGMLGNG